MRNKNIEKQTAEQDSVQREREAKLEEMRQRVQAMRAKVLGKAERAQEMIIQNATLKHLVTRNFKAEVESGQKPNSVPLPFVLTKCPAISV